MNDDRIAEHCLEDRSRHCTFGRNDEPGGLVVIAPPAMETKIR